MNLHPIFVHFPIALLTVYALMELVRYRKITNQPYWFYAKGLFLLIGGLGALAALFTGDMARGAVEQGTFQPAVANFRQVVSMHENFADLSIAIFGILAVSYLFLWLQRLNFSTSLEKYGMQTVWNFLLAIAHFFVETRLVLFMALAGLVCITITGGLGGIMVYGPSADPFFGVIYNILF